NVPPSAGRAPFELEEGPEGSVRVAARWLNNGVAVRIRTEAKLPEGSARTKLGHRDNGRWAVSYRVPRPATKGEEDRELKSRPEPRREVLPALHKVYADPTWPTYYLARTTFANSTGETITNVRIRCRVSTSAGQTSWSDWEETASAVYPGQSVQYPLHP